MKRVAAAMLCAILTFGADVAAAHPHSPDPSASPSLVPTPTPTPAPVCAAEDAAIYSACVASCDAAASAICSGQGHIDGFVAFLTSSLASCSIPGIDQRREYNGLKETIEGLRESGIISKSASKSLRKQADACRRALEVYYHGENHN